MKKYWVLALFIAGILFSCAEKKSSDATTKEQVVTAGEKFAADKIVPVAQLEKTMNGTNNFETVIEGKVQSVCQKKGCWMRIEKGNGENMIVTFKDYGFFMPKDCAGKTAVMKGIAYYDTISVDMLKHYAEDAGKPQEEIDKITDPEIAVSFEAIGVVLK